SRRDSTSASGRPRPSPSRSSRPRRRSRSSSPRRRRSSRRRAPKGRRESIRKPSKGCRTTAATSSTTPSSLPALPSCRGRTATNDPAGTAHVNFKNDSLSSQPKNPDGSESPKFSSTQTQAGFTIGGPIQRDRLFYFGALDIQKASSTKQTDPLRIEQRVVDAF